MYSKRINNDTTGALRVSAPENRSFSFDLVANILSMGFDMTQRCLVLLDC